MQEMITLSKEEYEKQLKEEFAKGYIAGYLAYRPAEFPTNGMKWNPYRETWEYPGTYIETDIVTHPIAEWECKMVTASGLNTNPDREANVSDYTFDSDKWMNVPTVI